MPIGLKDLELGSHSAPVTFNGETSVITYKPGIINGKRMKVVLSAMNSGDLDVLYDFLDECVTDWDLIDKKGDSVTVTREMIDGNFPLPFIRTVFSAIMDASSDVGEAQSS